MEPLTMAIGKQSIVGTQHKPSVEQIQLYVQGGWHNSLAGSIATSLMSSWISSGCFSILPPPRNMAVSRLATIN